MKPSLWISLATSLASASLFFALPAGLLSSCSSTPGQESLNHPAARIAVRLAAYEFTQKHPEALWTEGLAEALLAENKQAALAQVAEGYLLQRYPDQPAKRALLQGLLADLIALTQRAPAGETPAINAAAAEGFLSGLARTRALRAAGSK